MKIFSKMTDAEKEARDYQLHRAIDMVRAMAKMNAEEKAKNKFLGF